MHLFWTPSHRFSQRLPEPCASRRQRLDANDFRSNKIVADEGIRPAVIYFLRLHNQKLSSVAEETLKLALKYPTAVFAGLNRPEALGLALPELDIRSMGTMYTDKPIRVAVQPFRPDLLNETSTTDWASPEPQQIEIWTLGQFAQYYQSQQIRTSAPAMRTARQADVVAAVLETLHHEDRTSRQATGSSSLVIAPWKIFLCDKCRHRMDDDDDGATGKASHVCTAIFSARSAKIPRRPRETAKAFLPTALH